MTKRAMFAVVIGLFSGVGALTGVADARTGVHLSRPTVQRELLPKRCDALRRLWWRALRKPERVNAIAARVLYGQARMAGDSVSALAEHLDIWPGYPLGQVGGAWTDLETVNAGLYSLRGKPGFSGTVRTAILEDLSFTYKLAASLETLGYRDSGGTYRAFTNGLDNEVMALRSLLRKEPDAP